MDQVTHEHRDRLLEQVSKSPAARLQLAELYRSLGHVDQAGRWGISTGGWTRTRERDVYASLISQRRPDAETMLRRLSGLGATEALTIDAKSVVQRASGDSAGPTGLTGWRAQLDFVSRWTAGPVAGIGAVVATVMVVGVLIVAFVGSDDLRAPARLGVCVAALALCFAATFRLPACVLRKQWFRLAALVLLATITETVFVILASSPSFELPFEN